MNSQMGMVQRVLCTGTSGPWSWGVCHPPRTWMRSSTWKLPKSGCVGDFMEALFHRYDWSNHWPLVTELSLASLSLEDGGEAESSNPLVTGAGDQPSF